MSPDEAISMIDRQIDAHGQPIFIERGDDTLPARAFVRGYRPEELVGGIEQGDVMVTLSPTALAGSVFELDTPDRLDAVLIDERRFTVQMADPVKVGGVLARINLQVRG